MNSILEIFKIGIGPSSSHTVAPMRAALEFIVTLKQLEKLHLITKLKIKIYGSLALTGEGHGIIFAILNGLYGENPKDIDPNVFISNAEAIKKNQQITLLKIHNIIFNINNDIELHKNEFLPEHSNGLHFFAYNDQKLLFDKKYFSIGGGFIMDEAQMHQQTKTNIITNIPFPFSNAEELIKQCLDSNLTIAELVLQNELTTKTYNEIHDEILEITQTMHQSIINGINNEGYLPGELKVKRRAKELFNKINNPSNNTIQDKKRMLAMVYAIAVNEENADFKKIVTAPTNGAAGTIPAVLEYYCSLNKNMEQQKKIDFILTASAIGMLFKINASISAAEVGCQGEIGVACSMASAALTAVLGGNVLQVTQAAEIAMEHNLGMTCDPILGLVQVPCIERNGVAVTKAIDIAQLALLDNGVGIVSLDQVIATMLQTGRDMNKKYKETSLGGLSVNVIEC